MHTRILSACLLMIIACERTTSPEVARFTERTDAGQGLFNNWLVQPEGAAGCPGNVGVGAETIDGKTRYTFDIKRFASATKFSQLRTVGDAQQAVFTFDLVSDFAACTATYASRFMDEGITGSLVFAGNGTAEVSLSVNDRAGSALKTSVFSNQAIVFLQPAETASIVALMSERIAAEGLSFTVSESAKPDTPHALLEGTLRPQQSVVDEAASPIAPFLKDRYYVDALAGRTRYTPSTNRLPAIRDQGICGACWAFAAVAALEMQRNGGKNTDLSEQQLVDCLPVKEGQNKCVGAFMRDLGDVRNLHFPLAFNVIVSESVYPYVSGETKVAGTCAHRPNSNQGLEVGFGGAYTYISDDPSQVSSDSEIKIAVMTHEAVVVTTDAPTTFEYYKGGVYDNCNVPVAPEDRAAHAVVIVGWDDSTNSWLIRNSWGTRWGESGYMRIKRKCLNIGAWANVLVRGTVCTNRNLTCEPFIQAKNIEKL